MGNVPKGKLVIFDLCGGTGAWSAPYRDAGYDVRIVEPKLGLFGDSDVRLLEVPDVPVHGVLAAPPCTHFAIGGATHWKRKGMGPVLEGLSVVDACLRFIWATRPTWWALENPHGRLARWLGPPLVWFDPCDYGDPWTKRTGLWGNFTIPEPSPVPVTVTKRNESIKGHGEARRTERSVTPPGFARAFFEANP